MEDRAAEIAALRHRAYSRSGTDDDRRRLAELESSAAPDPDPASDPEAVAESADESIHTAEAPVRFTSWRAAGVGALVGAVLATTVTLAVVAATAAQPQPAVAAALSVFEREPLQIDDPANVGFAVGEFFRDAEGSLLEDLDDVTVRWVGAAGANEVYAARWNQGEGFAICLIVASADQAGMACTPETDFIERGLRMSAAGVELKWGPTDREVWVTTFR